MFLVISLVLIIVIVVVVVINAVTAIVFDLTLLKKVVTTATRSFGLRCWRNMYSWSSRSIIQAVKSPGYSNPSDMPNDIMPPTASDQLFAVRYAESCDKPPNWASVPRIVTLAVLGFDDAA